LVTPLFVPPWGTSLGGPPSGEPPWGTDLAENLLGESSWFNHVGGPPLVDLTTSATPIVGPLRGTRSGNPLGGPPRGPTLGKNTWNPIKWTTSVAPPSGNTHRGTRLGGPTSWDNPRRSTIVAHPSGDSTVNTFCEPLSGRPLEDLPRGNPSVVYPAGDTPRETTLPEPSVITFGGPSPVDHNLGTTLVGPPLWNTHQRTPLGDRSRDPSGAHPRGPPSRDHPRTTLWDPPLGTSLGDPPLGISLGNPPGDPSGDHLGGSSCGTLLKRPHLRDPHGRPLGQSPWVTPRRTPLGVLIWNPIRGSPLGTTLGGNFGGHCSRVPPCGSVACGPPGGTPLVDPVGGTMWDNPWGSTFGDYPGGPPLGNTPLGTVGLPPL
jgi:hypothetical protein